MKPLFKFERKVKMVTVLEIGHDWLKIVQAQFLAKTWKIHRVVSEDVSSFRDKHDEKISQQIRSLLKESKTEPGMFITVVPYQVVAIRSLEFPSTNLDEIKNMVELQISKQTPFSIDEMIYDYEILSINAEGYSRVMLAIVHQDVTRRYSRILKAAKLKMERVALSSEGLLAWHRFVHNESVNNALHILIDLDFSKSNFTVVCGGKVVFCRNLSIGIVKPLTETDEWREKFINAVKQSIYAYQNENEAVSEEIDKIVITGAKNILELLDLSVLKDKLNLEVEIVPQFKNICEDPNFLVQENNKNVENISIAPLLGFGLTPDEQKINLIPLQLRLEKGMKEREKDLYSCGIYLAFILIIVSSIFFGKAYIKKQYLFQLKEEAAKVSEKAEKLSGMLKEIEEVRERIYKRDVALKFIYEIHKAIFPEIYLTSINFDGEDQVILRGVSSVMSEVFDFLNALEKSECFYNVKTKFVTTRKIENKDITEFEIECPIETSFKKEPIEDK